MRTVVVGDLHGAVSGLRRLLREAGATDEAGELLPDTQVVQIGDCIHGGSPHPDAPDADDLACFELACCVCKYLILGNHELSHLFPDAGFPMFAGQRPLGPSLDRALRLAWERRQLRVAVAHDGWLLTHAGLHPRWRLRGSAESVAHSLVAAFALRLRAGQATGVFDAVGRRRGGRDEAGGIFWCDLSELTAALPFRDSALGLRQIVGHTPQPGGPVRCGDLWCVDSGAALSGYVCALVQPEMGAEWEPLVVASR